MVTGGAHQELTVRSATMADVETLRRWRNDPETRRNLRHRGEVAPEHHREWLASNLEQEMRVVLLIASDTEGDVGTVRWDRLSDDEWEVSITVAPERRGQGLSRNLLSSCERAFDPRAREVCVLTAVIHRDNAASRRLFEGAGYRTEGAVDSEGFLRHRKPVDLPTPHAPGQVEHTE
jgi:RimJ/RimL family protein N-acetyltransferase